MKTESIGLYKSSKSGPCLDPLGKEVPVWAWGMFLKQGVYKAPQMRTKLRMRTTFAVRVPLKVRKLISGYAKDNIGRINTR